jgi:hypothetical protein
VCVCGGGGGGGGGCLCVGGYVRLSVCLSVCVRACLHEAGAAGEEDGLRYVGRSVLRAIPSSHGARRNLEASRAFHRCKQPARPPARAQPVASP